jgi:flagellar FliJ protein
MKKFNFPLQKVLQHRKIQENLAQAEFLQAQAELNDLIERLQSLENSKTEARHLRHKNEVEGIQPIGSLVQVHDFLQGQDLRIKKTKEEISLKETVVENLREILRNKVVEHKIIESFKEKKKQQFRQEYKKHSQKLVDDITLMRFEREQSEEEN